MKNDLEKISCNDEKGALLYLNERKNGKYELYKLKDKSEENIRNNSDKRAYHLGLAKVMVTLVLGCYFIDYLGRLKPNITNNTYNQENIYSSSKQDSGRESPSIGENSLESRLIRFDPKAVYQPPINIRLISETGDNKAAENNGILSKVKIGGSIDPKGNAVPKLNYEGISIAEVIKGIKIGAEWIVGWFKKTKTEKESESQQTDPNPKKSICATEGR